MAKRAKAKARREAQSVSMGTLLMAVPPGAVTRAREAQSASGREWLLRAPAAVGLRPLTPEAQRIVQSMRPGSSRLATGRMRLAPGMREKAWELQRDGLPPRWLAERREPAVAAELQEKVWVPQRLAQRARRRWEPPWPQQGLPEAELRPMASPEHLSAPRERLAGELPGEFQRLTEAERQRAAAVAQSVKPRPRQESLPAGPGEGAPAEGILETPDWGRTGRQRRPRHTAR
jgi:hypothetical protein